MRKLLVLLAVCILAAPAFARPHLHRVVVAHREPNFFERLFGVHQAPQPAPRSRHRPVIRTPRPELSSAQHVDVSDTARPSDCYGIAWCGCWLRHHLGLSDVRLNLARAWATIGSAATPAIGVIVVWAHHVGIITGHDGSNWIVTSGNAGNSRHALTQSRSLRGAIAFRRL
jgi:hypothetical protein